MPRWPPFVTARPHLRRLITLFGTAIFLVAVIRTAWLGDDAFITFRTIDNFVGGYGLRWNVAERVQTFTHPLWLFAVAVPYAITGEAFFTPLLLSILLSAVTVWTLLSRIAASAATAVIAAAAVVFSKAFVDYSTSGLENPLTHALLAAFAVMLIQAPPNSRHDRRLLWLCLVTALLMLNRLDTGLIVLPALAVEAYRAGWRLAVPSVCIGFAPLAAWEVFSLVYYGTPFPNTAYAKLGIGASGATLAAQGLLYLRDSISSDPVTLLATACLTIAALAHSPRSAWPLAAGVLLYLVYVVRIGGDFMSGRFIAAPFLVAVMNAVRLEWRLPRPAAATLVAAFVVVCTVLGLFATTRPPLRSGTETFILAAKDGLGLGGVADERVFYYRYTGLLRWTRARPLPWNAEVQWGQEAAAAGQRVVVHHNIGLYGFSAGPSVHIVDPYALGDPLLARLPPLPGWRIGHFERAVPDGYVRSIETGQNLITDPDIGNLYWRVKQVTQDPLWSRRRWRAIAAINGWR